MFSYIKQLSSQSLTYGLGTVITRMVAFFLLPVFTHHMTPEEYGVYALYYMAIAVAMDVMRLGQDIALIRFYVLDKDERRRRLIFSTLFWGALLTTTALSLAVWLGAEHLVKLVVSFPEPYPEWSIYTLKLCAGIIWFDNISAFPLVVIRGEGQARRFTAIKLIGVIVQVVVTLYLLIEMKRGIAGIFEANLVSAAVIFVACIPTVWQKLKLAFDRSILKACLAFGLPNVPTALFVLVVELADVKLLELLRSSFEMGLYRAGYRLSAFLAIVATGFRFAWQPFFLSIADKPDAKTVYSRVLTYYLAVVSWIYLMLTAVVLPLARWNIPSVGPLIDPEYWAGLEIFPVVLIAHVFNGAFAIFTVGIYIEKKTKVLPLITGIAAALNIVGNMITIPVYGMWGAAWFTVISYAVMAALLCLYNQRIYFVHWEWRRIIHISIVSTVVFLISRWCNLQGIQWASILLSFSFPVILLASGFLTKGERSRLRLKIIR